MCNGGYSVRKLPPGCGIDKLFFLKTEKQGKNKPCFSSKNSKHAFSTIFISFHAF